MIITNLIATSSFVTVCWPKKKLNISQLCGKINLENISAIDKRQQ
jgi:hypothetical protein